MTFVQRNGTRKRLHGWVALASRQSTGKMPVAPCNHGARIIQSRLVPATWVCFGLLLGGCAPADRPPADGPASQGPAGAVSSQAAPQPITTKTGAEMVRVPGGAFVMGDDDGEADEKPAHRVRLSPFYVDVTEVTQASFEHLMGRNPSRFTGEDRPVDQVSWHDAVEYCNLRSLREGLSPCYDADTLECDFDADGYRLPTEAEWEYACRAGTTTSWSFGDDPGLASRHAWVKDNANDTSHPVRRKPPNPWGLYDLHGNLAEWCNDYYAETYERGAEAGDPRGPAEGDARVVRGGCWATGAARARSAARGGESPAFVDVCFRRDAYGFRCVRRADGGTD